jgi:hypothetical protein
MAMLRIALGCIATLSLLMQLPFAADYYSKDGLLPAPQLDQWQYRLTVLNPLKHADPLVAFTYVAILALVAAAFTLGWKTRWMSAVLALGIIFLQNRNPLILNSGDGMLRLTLMYLAFAPTGLCLSLDRWLLERRAAAKGEKPPPFPEVSMWPQRLVALQVALLYLAATWHKWYGPSWRQGTAAWYPLQLPEFNRFPVPPLFETAAFAKGMTFATLVLELLLCTMVFYRPARKWVLGAAIVFHAMLDYRLNIPLFGPTVVACYIAFYEGDEVKAWLDRLFAKHRVAPVPGAD